MKLHSIETGTFKLDGGTMFGVVPKSIWSKKYNVDENNMSELSMRCLYIEDGNKKVLIDCGMGTKLDENFLKYYFPNYDNSLLKSLDEIGIKPEEITDLVLTHLHFDHCGGATYRDQDGNIKLQFENAKIHIGEGQVKTYKESNPREKHSMFKENIDCMLNSKNANIIDSKLKLTKNIKLKLFSGHTDDMIIPIVKYNDRKIIYAADLIPTSGNVHVPYVASYDVKPLKVFKEKEKVLTKVAKENSIIFFEHDINIECATIENTEKGFKIKDTFKLEEIVR
jgi:glyoxylase-like metal-dependent hydrolase (beta-lactamase superfamily II)